MNPIKTSRLLRVLGILAIFATAGIGAQMQVEEPPEPGGGGVSTFNVTTTSFTFSGIGDIPPCSIGVTDIAKCQFLNNSGVDWTSLTLSIAPGDEPVFCAAFFGFDSCNAQQGTSLLPTVLTFAGGAGIAQGEILAFAGSGWPSLTTFAVAANGVPEPSSIALILSGLATLGFLRRRR